MGVCRVGEGVPLSPEPRRREVRPRLSFLGEHLICVLPAAVPGKSSLRRGVSVGDKTQGKSLLFLSG